RHRFTTGSQHRDILTTRSTHRPVKCSLCPLPEISRTTRKLFLEEKTSTNSAIMAPSRVRDEATQADIPTDVKNQLDARLLCFKESCDSLESASHALIETVTSYQVVDTLEGLQFFNRALRDFLGPQNELKAKYQQLVSWVNVTGRDRSWGHQLLALFEPVKTTYKAWSAAVVRRWNVIFRDLTQKCFRLMSDEELEHLHARLEVEMERAQDQQPPEGQVLAGVLYAMDINADDDE
ncbi:hypothetical protein CONLIGDRAFT_703333, partial [Coniochaeta ligniaria NRRL 30616]